VIPALRKRVNSASIRAEHASRRPQGDEPSSGGGSPVNRDCTYYGAERCRRMHRLWKDSPNVVVGLNVATIPSMPTGFEITTTSAELRPFILPILRPSDREPSGLHVDFSAPSPRLRLLWPRRSRRTEQRFRLRQLRPRARRRCPIHWRAGGGSPALPPQRGRR